VVSAEQMAAAEAAAEAHGAKDAEATKENCAIGTWIELVLEGEDGVGIPGERYIIELPDGSKRMGRTDASGCVYLDGLPEGDCKLDFPNLDKEAWESAD